MDTKETIMKRLFTTLLIILIIFYYGQHSTTQLVCAAIKNGEMITLTQSNQVIDSIDYNGATIEAVYSNGSYASNDTTYSCAAFIKKFYRTVYGAEVYNLINSSSVPLIYDNKGTFSLTDNPQKGDIVRDNTRTHWAIVKSISGNTITIIQQSYRSGTSAWINCTIDKGDTGFSFFTYSNRIPDATQNGEEAIIENEIAPVVTPGVATVEGSDPSLSTGMQGDGSFPTGMQGDGSFPAGIQDDASLPTVIKGNTTGIAAWSSDNSMSAAQINNGTYLLIQGTGTAFMEAAQQMDQGQIQAAEYSGLEDQKISIVNHGKNEYSMQFLSDQRFLSVSKAMQFISTDTLEQRFVFIHRGNGYYTISLADNLNKVIAVDAQSLGGCGNLALKEFSGALNEVWYLNPVSTQTLPILPRVTIKSKTLYAGYKSYTIKVKQLLEASTVSYSSSNPEVATVSKEGTISPVKKGKTIITVEVRQEFNTYTSQIAVTVKEYIRKVK